MIEIREWIPGGVTWDTKPLGYSVPLRAATDLAVCQAAYDTSLSPADKQAIADELARRLRKYAEWPAGMVGKGHLASLRAAKKRALQGAREEV